VYMISEAAKAAKAVEAKNLRVIAGRPKAAVAISNKFRK